MEGPPKDVLKALASLRAEAKACGLDLVLAKCKALWSRQTAPPPEVVAQVLQSGLTLVYGTTDSLGALVGHDDVAIRKWALEKAMSHDQLFAALLHPAMPVQHAMAILRFCAIPRMNYLTRVIRPDLLRPACEYFDKKVFETALTKLGLPSIVTDAAYTLLTQPIRLGGFGLRRMASVSPAAYWSSFSQAAPDIVSLVRSRLLAPEAASPPHSLSDQLVSDVPGTSPVVLAADPAPAAAPSDSSVSSAPASSFISSPRFLEAVSALPCTRAVISCHEQLKEAGVKASVDVFPEKPTDLWTWYGQVGAGRGLQRLLIAEVEDNRAARLFQESHGDPVTVARLTSVRSKLAGVWLNTYPVSRDHTLTDNHFRMAARLRLGLPPQDDLPRQCSCQAVLQHDPLHFYSCGKLKQSAMTMRHDLIVRTLSRYVQRAGGSCYVEPKFYLGKRPDVHIFFPSSRTMVDVSVIHPGALSFARQAHVPLAAAHLRERQKVSKYRKVAEGESASFVPFVLETLGGFGTQALKFVSDVASLARENLSLAQSEPDFRGSMVRCLAIALQVGNAHVALCGSLMSREHAGRRIGAH